MALYTNRTPMSRLLPLLALVLSLPLPIFAHVGAGAGDTDLLPKAGDPSAVVLEAPWGLVVGASDGRFDWICHEVLSSGVAELPEFEISSDGTMLGVSGLLTGVAVSDESLYRSTDGGCSWDPVGGTTGRLIIDAGFDPEDASVVLGVTANPAGSDEPIRNAILRSTDGGATFTEIAAYDGRVFRAVRFGAGGVAYALGTDQEPFGAILLRSDDGGETWVERPVPDDALETPAFGSIAAVDPVDSDEVWLVFDGNEDDGTLRTTDGGQTFVAVQMPVSLVLDLTLVADGSAWLVGDARRLWNSADRSEWTEQPDAPQVWGGAWADGELRLAVNTLAHDEALVRTTDGASFSTILETLDLRGPLSCAPGTTVATVCEPLWDDLYRSLTLMRPRPSGDDDDDDSAPMEPSSTCDGCGGGASAALLPLVFAGGCGLRRRRVV